MADASASRTSFRREIRLLIGALVGFLAALVVTLFALAISILRIDTLGATADGLTRQVASVAETASTRSLEERLHLMREDADLVRVEVYRGNILAASSGDLQPEAEVLTRQLTGGHIVFYFEPSARMGGRRQTLLIGAMATVAAIAGLLILIVYLRRFFSPVEQMLAEARRFTEGRKVDDDARYLVQTFRDAVERVQRQASEIEQLRGATSGRSPDLAEITRMLDRSFLSGLLAIDADGSVLSVNEPARQILRLVNDDPPFPLRRLGDSEFADLVREAFSGRSAVNRREVRLAGEIVVGCTSVPLFDGSRFLGMLVLFVDVTASRAMESRVRDFESLVALGHMSAGIAHEFRNALFTILGYLKLALRNAPEEAAAKIRSAEAEAQKIARTVDLLLAFTRPLNLRARKLRLDELVAGVMQETAARHPEIRVSTHLDSVEIDGDPELLERAVENVVRNAVEAVREKHPEGGGSVEALVSAGERPAIEIRDNGPGIDPSMTETYLLPFQSGKAQGTGLGLPLARKIVLHHGGTLTIGGTHGEGAVVRIEFF